MSMQCASVLLNSMFCSCVNSIFTYCVSFSTYWIRVPFIFFYCPRIQSMSMYWAFVLPNPIFTYACVTFIIFYCGRILSMSICCAFVSISIVCTCVQSIFTYCACQLSSSFIHLFSFQTNTGNGIQLFRLIIG